LLQCCCAAVVSIMCPFSLCLLFATVELCSWFHHFVFRSNLLFEW
jgi:hypothetical protein